MKSLFIGMLSALAFVAHAQQLSGYTILKQFSISGNAGWDYLSVHGHELYVSHGNQVNILDKVTGDSLGILSNTEGVHGIAFIEAEGKGYTSNGRLNTVTVFRLADHQELQQIPAGQNPDAILYDPFSGMLVTCNGRSNDLTVINPKTNKVINTIPVGGKPETAVTDGRGKWFVNIEDKNEIVVINARNLTVVARWSIAPGESPTGLAYDPVTRLLFAGCEKRLMVVDAVDGKIVEVLPIGDGCDGVALDIDRRLVFTSNGEGNMTIVKINPGKHCSVWETIPTQKGARTIAIDEGTHQLYLPTAEFGEWPAGAKQGTRPPLKAGSFHVMVIGPIQ
jgi:YVTN family beta-propeller protein